jgi:hypothetical protein
VQWRDRRRLAKKRARVIKYGRGQDKKRQLYRKLIAATEASRDELQAMAAGLAEAAEIETERACRGSALPVAEYGGPTSAVRLR